MEINRLSGLPQPPLEESDLSRNVELPGASPQPPSGPLGPAAGSIQGPAASGFVSALQDNAIQSSVMQLNLNQQMQTQTAPTAGGPFGPAAGLPGQTAGMSTGPFGLRSGGSISRRARFSDPRQGMPGLSAAPRPGLRRAARDWPPGNANWTVRRVLAGPTALGPAAPNPAMMGGPAAGAPAGPAMGGPVFSSPIFGSNPPPLGIPIPGAPQQPDPDAPANTPQVSLDYEIK